MSRARNILHEIRAHFWNEDACRKGVCSARTTRALLVQECTYVEGARMAHTSYKRTFRARTPVSGGNEHDVHELHRRRSYVEVESMPHASRML